MDRDIAVGEEAILAFAHTRLTHEIERFKEFFKDTDHGVFPTLVFANYLLSANRAEDKNLYEKLRALPGAEEYMGLYRDYTINRDEVELARFAEIALFDYGSHIDVRGELDVEYIVKSLKGEVERVKARLEALSEVFEIDVQARVAERVRFVEEKLASEKMRILAPFTELEKALAKLKPDSE